MASSPSRTHPFLVLQYDLVPISVEDSPSAMDIHVVARSGGDVCIIRKATLVDALGGLDDFI